MFKLLKPGRIIFALGIIALGVLQFFTREYIVGRPPQLTWPSWAATMPGKLAWAYVSGSLLILAGVSIIFTKLARGAAIFIAVMVIVYSYLMRHLPAMADWVNSFKTLALAGGAFIVAASLGDLKNGRPSNADDRDLVSVGCLFIALFFIDAGIAHFRFDDFIINGFMPAYIPAHAFWTYFCGVALMAGGVGILLRPTRRLAAFLSGVMILLWFFMVHIPRAINNPDPKNYGEWMGVCESFTFVGILFVLATLNPEKKVSD